MPPSLASSTPAAAPGHSPEQERFARELSLASAGAMTLGDLMERANGWQASGQAERAALLYERWVAASNSPMRHVACFNWGAVLGAMQRYEQAEQAYRTALTMAPGFHHARVNLGHQLEHLGRIDEALDAWREVWEAGCENPAAVPRELQLHAVNNLARCLEQARRLADAEHYMVKSLEFEPHQRDVLQHYVHVRQKQCAWPVYKPVGDVTENQMLMSTSALAMLSASDDPALQLLAASRFVSEKVSASTEQPLHDPLRRPHERLRVGYVSSDFCLHAMGLLIPELLELHDRSRVEVYGFCWSREDGTALRERLIGAMDHHIRLGGLDDLSAARLIASHEIDVLIDLHGLSSGARPAIMGHRPAPVQIGYLGLPATSAVPGVDYMIADRYVMQPEYLPYCTEQPMYVSHCYQVSDRQRKVAKKPRRSDYDLPDDAFVFCSFNNNHKFSEPVFKSWMRILGQVPDSVLWLLADNEPARENMLTCADQHGIDRERLIFAPRVAPDEYLARFALADLFLDTFPYNAGATANDVLWMGTPILTRSGKTYISRMAGSLLTSVGLPELITETVADYERMAVNLGRHPTRCESYRRYLTEHGRQSPLFDVPALVREIEQGYARLAQERWQRAVHAQSTTPQPARA